MIGPHVCRLATLLLCLCAGGLAAQEVPANADPPLPPAGEPSPPPPTKWEGALGLSMSMSPEYQGASRYNVSARPAFFIRYGRFVISSGGGFVTRRRDDVFRGLGMDVVQRDRLRLNVSLRLDHGRRSSSSDALVGIQDVRRTVRVRSSATWQLDHGWKLAASWNADLLGRGGGHVVDLGIGHDRRLSPRTTWSVGGGLVWADRRNTQSYYGVTPEESQASGYPVYMPGSGLRGASLNTGWRMEIDPEWTAYWGGSIGKLLGPAVDSPFTGSTRGWSLNGGLARRF
jgi:outer membrane protein